MIMNDVIFNGQWTRYFKDTHSTRTFSNTPHICNQYEVCGVSCKNYCFLFQCPPRDAGQGGEMSIAPGNASSARN